MSLAIGEMIKNKRIKLGYSQEELSKLIGFKSRSSIFKIEKGIAGLTTEQLKIFSKVLDIPLIDFFQTSFLELNQVLFLIYNELFILHEKDKKELLLKCNNYYIEHFDFFEDLKNLNQIKKLYKYTLPLNQTSRDKDILDFAYRNNLIDINFLEIIKNNEKFNNFKYTENDIENFLSQLYNENPKNKNLENNKNIIVNLNLSSDKEILKLQKEIIEITTEIDNKEIVEDIRDIAQLKLNKMKK